jgi:hypothetical protein
MVWFHLLVASLWPLIWHFGIAAVLIGLLLAGAFLSASIPIVGPFLAPLRKTLIWIAVVIAAGMFCVGWGVNIQKGISATQNVIIKTDVIKAVTKATDPKNTKPDPFDSKDN